MHSRTVPSRLPCSDPTLSILSFAGREFEHSPLPPKDDLVPSSREGTEPLQTSPLPGAFVGSRPRIQQAMERVGPARPPGMQRMLEGRGPADLGIVPTPNLQPTLGAKTPRKKEPFSRADLGAPLTAGAPAENPETESGLPFPRRTRQRQRRGSVVMPRRSAPSKKNPAPRRLSCQPRNSCPECMLAFPASSW